MNDLRLALRRLRHAPGFAAVAVLTLALAIGANTAVFSIADAVLFRPFPYENVDRLATVRMRDPETGARYTLVSAEHMQLLDGLDDVIEGVGRIDQAPSMLITIEAGTESVRRAVATASYFGLLGIEPARGRLFDASDLNAGGDPTLLTWATFQRHFEGNDDVVGASVRLGDRTVDVIGVLPRDFIFPSSRVQEAEVVGLMREGPGDDSALYPLVLLRPGVDPARAQERIAAVTGGTLATDGIPVLEDIRAVLYPTGRPVMRFLLAASLLVLLLGCANLANMLLARTRLREREIGVQAAIGASRSELLRPLIVEALILGVLAAIGALAMTALAFEMLLRQVPPAAVGQAPVGVDGRVALFTMALGLLASIAFAIVPAWRASRLDATVLLRGTAFGSDRRGSFGRPMLVTQAAVAVVLVFGGLIAARALAAVLSVPLGFDPERVITVRYFPSGDDGAARQTAYTRALDEIRTLPGVLFAGATGSLPISGGVPDEGTETLDGVETAAGIFHVLPGYFEAVDTVLLRGRLPNQSDVDSGADVAVVAESAARLLFGSGDPIGQVFRSNTGRSIRVIGVVDEVTRSLTRDGRPPAYVIPNQATGALTLVVKTRSRDDATLAEIRRLVSDLTPGVPVTADWWSDQLSAMTAYRNPRFQTIVLGSFASLALGLTALGVFGLVAFLVASRMRELGIRMAIGAAPSRLLRHALGHALTPALVGIGIGLLATRLLARLAASQLYEVETGDPTILLAAALAVAVAALVAAWFPARRATRVDPMQVLRAD